MLIHPWDRADDDAWRAVVAQHDFGDFVAGGGAQDYPIVVPTHFDYVPESGDHGQGLVLTHFAKPNPVWAALESNPHAVLVINADWVYVEAEWNSRDPEHGVPTSYYTSIQLRGRTEIVDEPEELADLLSAQLTHFEPADSRRLPVSAAFESDRRQLKAIRGVRLHVEEVLAKQKYGGNKPPDHRREIADHLERRSGPGDSAARRHLLRRLDESW